MLNKSTLRQMGGIILLSFVIVQACATSQGMEAGSSANGPLHQEQPFAAADENRTNVHVLFLGGDSEDRPRERLRDGIHVYAEKGIQIHYTENQEDINLENLNKYDVFMQYGNRSGLTRQQEQDLLNYVHNGGGFVSVHASSASFNDSDAFVKLVGGA